MAPTSDPLVLERQVTGRAASEPSYTIAPDPSRAAPFRRFWRATGFSPGELLLTPEMQRTLQLAGKTPLGGVEYLRPHFLLNLVRDTGDGYDFALLEEAVDVMVENGFTPFFEIMGNPSGTFDFTASGWPERWRDLVATMTERFAKRYGAELLRTWYFESWNEPDLPWWEHGEDAFLSYYDACTAGLDAALPGLTVGGPGTARTLSSMFRTFVAHCGGGTNRLTGEPPRIDFVSVHEKGVRKSFEDLAPDSLGIIARERQAVDYLRQHHPKLAELPLINNECDPQVGWWQHHTWRGTAYAPAMIAKIIDQHHRLMDDTPFDMLFNDNGFMGEWGQRTHFTLFGGRSTSRAQSEHVTDLAVVEASRSAEPFSLIKKPALTVMEMLAQLGDTVLSVDDLEPDAAYPNGTPGAIATRHADGTFAVLIYNSRDAVRVSGKAAVRLELPGAARTWDVVVLALDDLHANPFALWEVGRRPGPPIEARLSAPDEALQAMRRAAEPREVERRRIEGALVVEVAVPLPSVSLVLARPAADDPPPPPEPTVRSVPGLNGEERLVAWPDLGTVGIAFEVAVAAEDAEPRPVVDAPILANAFVLDPLTRGVVHVRSVALSGATSAWVRADDSSRP